ncbi:MAG: PLDc N-terminal domain-containing protein [Bacteroidetes bacterium]|nr:PLDc N-terminal domain-containing protein [Bacteroidota bacterium]
MIFSLNIAAIIFYFILIGIVMFLVWLWTILGIIQQSFNGNDKLGWLVVMIFLALLGAIRPLSKIK